jgi:type I restriction enzyme S subunit
MSEGYKKSELGEIPSQWFVKNLGELADIKRGLASQHLNYVDGPSEGVRIIRINDFKSNDPKYIRETHETKKLTLKRNDVLMAGTGATAGISFLVRDEWVGYPFSYNAPRIRTNENINSSFLYFFLNTEIISEQQERLFTGNAQPFLDTRAIANLKIILPPLIEQQKIAEILTTLDEKIDVIDAQIIQNQELKKGLMQRLLTKGIGHTTFKPSPLGEIPESWQIKDIISLEMARKSVFKQDLLVPSYTRPITKR